MKRKTFRRITAMLLTTAMFVGMIATMLSSSAGVYNDTTYNVVLTGATTDYSGPWFYPTGDDHAVFALQGNGTYNIKIVNPDQGNKVIFEELRNGVSLFHYKFPNSVDARVIITRVGATQVTGNWTFRNRRITRSARVFHDSSAASMANSGDIFTKYAHATVGIWEKFGVLLQTNGQTTLTNHLNGDRNSPHHPTPCQRNTIYLCDDSLGCSNNNNCKTQHHRSLNRLLNIPDLRSTSIYTFRIVGHRICHLDSGIHKGAGGAADPLSRKDSIMSIIGGGGMYNNNLIMVIQHELGHNFNLQHCNNASCVMYPGGGFMNYWCNPHVEMMTFVKDGGNL